MATMKQMWENIKKNASSQMDRTVNAIKEGAGVVNNSVVLGDKKATDMPEDARKLKDLLLQAPSRARGNQAPLPKPGEN